MLYSPTTAAKAIGCHRETVRRIAAKLGIGQELPAGLVLSDKDLAAIRAAIQPVGNPQFRRRKKSGRK